MPFSTRALPQDFLDLCSPSIFIAIIKFVLSNFSNIMNMYIIKHVTVDIITDLICLHDIFMEKPVKNGSEIVVKSSL